MHLDKELEDYPMNFLSAADHIRFEYSAARAWVALNPYWAICIASVAGWLIGRIL